MKLLLQDVVLVVLLLLLLGLTTAEDPLEDQQDGDDCNSETRHPVLCHLQQLLHMKTDKWNKYSGNRETIASAYSSKDGQDPTGYGDAFTQESAEASAASYYSGVYYRDNLSGARPVFAADGVNSTNGTMANGTWAGAYSKNIPNNRYPGGTVSAIASNFDTEYSSQRGPMGISGTYEGSRSVAGSSSFFNLAQKDSLGGQVVATNIDAYGPTPGKRVVVRKGDDPYGRRSVAFTDIAPNSAAQTGAGNGPAAISTGYEVAAAARSGRLHDPPKLPPWGIITIGHRSKGDNRVFDMLENITGRRLLWHRRGLRASALVGAFNVLSSTRTHAVQTRTDRPP